MRDCFLNDFLGCVLAIGLAYIGVFLLQIVAYERFLLAVIFLIVVKEPPLCMREGKGATLNANHWIVDHIYWWFICWYRLFLPIIVFKEAPQFVGCPQGKFA